jgi:Insertion element 4 transposase N-terminal/Transposase DDE domain
MPRAGQTKPRVVPRLSDRIAIGVLTRTFPPGLVDRVIASTGRAEQRQRLLPARVVVYYTLAMCLFAQVGYEEVMRLLVEGLAWMRRWQGTWQVPDKSSLARARARLGPAPLRELFVEVARPLATKATKGAWYRNWRLLALDGTTLDVADTPANVAAFGRPGGGRGQGAFPQVRLVGLTECGTHVIVDAAMGGLHLGETSLAPSLARSLGPGMLLLVDQGLCGLELWRSLQATGAELVWRCRQDVKLPVLEVFADGSWRSELGAGHPKRKRVAVRVVDYRLDDPGRPGQPEDYRLLTTIGDPERAPAAELAALYPQRWEHETVLDELKTHQRGAGVVLRSKDPDGGHPGDLGAPAGPLRHPHPHAPGRPAGRSGSRPAIVYPQPAHCAAPGDQPGGVFPLGDWPGPRGRRPLRRCGTCCPRAGCVAFPEWSSAR